jgi:hypothetical protein
MNNIQEFLRDLKKAKCVYVSCVPTSSRYADAVYFQTTKAELKFFVSTVSRLNPHGTDEILYRLDGSDLYIN